MLQQRLKRICPVCRKENLMYLPQHLASVHKFNSLERKPYLKKAKYQGITVYSESLSTVHVFRSSPKRNTKRGRRKLQGH